MPRRDRTSPKSLCTTFMYSHTVNGVFINAHNSPELLVVTQETMGALRVGGNVMLHEVLFALNMNDGARKTALVE